MRGSWGALKPPVGTQLDRGHPLAFGLRGAWLLNEGGQRLVNLADGRPSSTAVGSPAWRQGPSGPALQINDGQYVPLQDVDLDYCTIVARARSTDATNEGVLCCKNFDGSNVPYALSIRDGTSVIDGFSFYNGAWQRSGTNTVDYRNEGRDRTFGGSFDGTNLRFWVDGQVRSTTTIAATVLPKNNNPLDLGTYRNNGWEFGGRVEWLLLYDRALNPAEMRALHADPFQLFAPPTWRRYYDAVGGGEPPAAADPPLLALLGCGS